jgi:hypothetical protein
MDISGVKLSHTAKLKLNRDGVGVRIYTLPALFVIT